MVFPQFSRAAARRFPLSRVARTKAAGPLTGGLRSGPGASQRQVPNHWIRIESRNELAALRSPIRRLLFDEFDLGAGINRFCPALLEDGQAVVVVVEAWRDSDQVDELLRQVSQRYPVSEPALLVVPAPLLLALVRGQVSAAGDGAGSRTGEAQRSSLVDAFHELVSWGVEHGASDLHINIALDEPASEVKYTIEGRYVTPARFANMPTSTLMDILAVAWMDIQGGNGAVFDPRIEQQGRLRLQVGTTPVLLRWASLATDNGPSVCLRILRLEARTLRSLEQLGYLPQQVETLDRARRTEGGAIVLAGVVGSGKSTTIATLMNMIPADRKIITLEDPVEYLIDGALQNTITRSVDDETRDVFQAKLRTIKRSAMNDLLVGEIRDRETGRAFMDLAGSGISVYTTVHAGAAMLIPDRLASDFIGIPRDFLATPGILKLLVYQTLVPRLCPHCALSAVELRAAGGKHSCDYAAVLARQFDVDPVSMRFRNPAGCESCRSHSLPELYGYCGRTVVAEMIEPARDDEFLRNVRRGDAIRQRRHLAGKRRSHFDEPDMYGKTALECAIYKVLQGEIDPRDIEARFRPLDVGPDTAFPVTRRVAVQPWVT